MISRNVKLKKGNAWVNVKNSTDADFYVITFNDADWTYTSYFGMYRVPRGQTVYVEVTGL